MIDPLSSGCNPNPKQSTGEGGECTATDTNGPSEAFSKTEIRLLLHLDLEPGEKKKLFRIEGGCPSQNNRKLFLTVSMKIQDFTAAIVAHEQLHVTVSQHQVTGLLRWETGSC